MNRRKRKDVMIVRKILVFSALNVNAGIFTAMDIAFLKIINVNLIINRIKRKGFNLNWQGYSNKK
jgi:hypothetical protein